MAFHYANTPKNAQGRGYLCPHIYLRNTSLKSIIKRHYLFKMRIVTLFKNKDTLVSAMILSTKRED